MFLFNENMLLDSITSLDINTKDRCFRQHLIFSSKFRKLQKTKKAYDAARFEKM